MELYKSILTLIKRFFFGTPENEVKVDEEAQLIKQIEAKVNELLNELHIAKQMENYLRHDLKLKNREIKDLELKVKLANLNK